MLVHLIVALVALAVIAAFLSLLETTSFSSFGIRLRYVLLVSRLRQAGEVLLKDSVEDLEAQKTAFLEKARDIAAKAETEKRDFTDEERKAVADAVSDAKSVHNRLLEKNGDAALLTQINELGRPIGELAKGGGLVPGQGKSLGERFTENDQLKDWLGSVKGGLTNEHTRVGNGPPIAFGGIKDLLTGVSDTQAGALVRSDWLGLVDTGTFMRPLTIRDVVTVGTTGSDAVEYARVTGFTNAAAPVAEATTDAGADVNVAGDALELPAGAGLKPKSTMTLEKVSTTVKTIAHWLPATKRALSDAAQIRTLIDNFLRYGLEEELEDQMVNGDNAGENFDGILHVGGTQAQAWDTNLLVTTRKAKTKVRTVGRARASAYVLNPEDNERIDLLRDDSGAAAGTGGFLFGSPAGLQTQTLWGLPRIESEAVPAGVGLVADFKQAVLWDREQAAVQVSDSHADFFIRNLVAILAEMRAAFGVIRPKAFVVIDLTA